MRLEGHKKLIRQMGQLPDAQRAHLRGSVYRNTEEGARVAKTLAPDVTGETRDNITTEYRDDGMTGEVVIIDSDAPRDEKDRSYSIEHGRKAGDRGTTEGYHFVWQTRKYLGKKWRARARRALNKAVREVIRG